MIPPRHALRLEGCTPRPLSGYLKALALLRLVAQQKDPEATGHWDSDTFTLTSSLDAPALSAFLLHDWVPSPIIAPWNGGSGFWPKDNDKALSVLITAQAPRFQPLAETLRLAREDVRRLGVTESPKDTAKLDFLSRLRSTLPDAALDWLDAAVLLTEDGAKYPPLLGTGGNDGRLDFTNNAHQHLLRLFDPETGAPTPLAESCLPGALQGEAVGGLLSAAVGQFAPGAAGGPNGTTGIEAESLVNPWDFVLTLEGAMSFAAAATRRLEGAGHVGMAYPFTVMPVGGGSGATAFADEAPARAEMWLPLWSQPASWADLRRLLAEGRATVGRDASRRAARDGLDFARAVGTLGVARGIKAFQRVGFLMRSGKAFLATPLGRVEVTEKIEAGLIEQLDRAAWLSRFFSFARGKTAPTRVQSLSRRLTDALFLQATHGGPEAVQATLGVLGEILLACARSPALREALPPPPELGAEWYENANDHTPAFRIACALASLDFGCPMLRHMAPLTLHRDKTGYTPKSQDVTWTSGTLLRNIRATVERRLITMDWDGVSAEGNKVTSAPLHGRRTARLADVARFLVDDSDDARINALIPGLTLIRSWPKLPYDETEDVLLPLDYTLMLPLFLPAHRQRKMGLVEDGTRLSPPPALIARLAANQPDEALTLAVRRLRGSGVSSPFLSQPNPSGVPGLRLLAALCIPVDRSGLRYALKKAGFLPASDPLSKDAPSSKVNGATP